MDRLVGVEEARPKLGELLDQIADGYGPFVLTKRGRAVAILVSMDEYDELKDAASEKAWAELDASLVDIRRRAREAGITQDDVDEAVREVRRLQR